MAERLWLPTSGFWKRSADASARIMGDIKSRCHLPSGAFIPRLPPHWLSAPDLIRCDRRSIRLFCRHLAGRASSISGDSVESLSAWNNDKDRSGSNSRLCFLNKAVTAVDCLVHYWRSGGLEGTKLGIKATCNLTWISKIYTWCRSWEFLTGSATIIKTKQKQK